MISELDKRIKDRQILAAQREGALRQVQANADNLEKHNAALTADAERYAGALDILRTYATMQEANVREKVEALVTEGLRAVFERDDLTFAFRFELGRSGQMTATPVLQTAMGEHVVETAATDARGGGVLDVAAFLLRCVMLCLMRPPLERVLFLDEIFKHLSRNHLANAAALLRTMSDRLGIQIVMVSHKDEFTDTADRVFDVQIKNGKTEIVQRGEK